MIIDLLFTALIVLLAVQLFNAHIRMNDIDEDLQIQVEYTSNLRNEYEERIKRIEECSENLAEDLEKATAEVKTLTEYNARFETGVQNIMNYSYEDALKAAKGMIK